MNAPSKPRLLRQLGGLYLLVTVLLGGLALGVARVHGSTSSAFIATAVLGAIADLWLAVNCCRTWSDRYPRWTRHKR